MNKVCVFLADGFEEIEALTVVDLLRREKIDTDIVSVTGSLTVTGAHQISVTADQLIEEADFSEITMLVLPGGRTGVQNLESCGLLMKQLDFFAASGKPIGAICAAPSILGHRGLLHGKKATCYPSFETHLAGASITRQPAVTDGTIITGRGMGCSIEFALAVVEYLTGPDTAKELADKIVYTH